MIFTTKAEYGVRLLIQLGLQGGEREAAQEPVPHRALAKQDRTPQRRVVAAPSEPLRPEQVRHAELPQACSDGFRPRERVGRVVTYKRRTG